MWKPGFSVEAPRPNTSVPPGLVRVGAVVNEVAIEELLMFEQQIELEVFLVAGTPPRSAVRAYAASLSCVMRGGVVGLRLFGPVADVLLKVPVLDRVIPDIRRRDDVHEHIVADFDKVAEPYHRLQRLLGGGDRHHCQQNNTHQCYLCQTVSWFCPP